jgi:hypothetical protein
MMFHVLTEGTSDDPTVNEILTRRFGLSRGGQFQIHPHGGKGHLPNKPNAKPNPNDRTLFGQLPAKLRAFAVKGADICVVVLVDQDDDDCSQLLANLRKMLKKLKKKPVNVLFRIAMEEIEAWFLADQSAITAAYAHATFHAVPGGDPDLIDDPSDIVAGCLGAPLPCTGQMKAEWAEGIAPHLDLDNPKSPSLAKFIEGVNRYWQIV